jgi:hypothetical protein
MFHGVPAGVDRAVAAAMAKDITIEDSERDLLGYAHAVGGGELARHRKLPEGICDAIARHHEVKVANGTIASVVALADQCCMSHGLVPGYVLPPKPGIPSVQHPPESTRRAKPVEALMDMVRGDAPGVSRLAAYRG